MHQLIEPRPIINGITNAIAVKYCVTHPQIQCKNQIEREDQTEEERLLTTGVSERKK